MVERLFGGFAPEANMPRIYATLMSTALHCNLQFSELKMANSLLQLLGYTTKLLSEDQTQF